MKKEKQKKEEKTLSDALKANPDVAGFLHYSLAHNPIFEIDGDTKLSLISPEIIATFG